MVKYNVFCWFANKKSQRTFGRTPSPPPTWNWRMKYFTQVAYTIKPFQSVIKSSILKAVLLWLVDHIYPSLMFESKAGAYVITAPDRLHSKVELTAWPSNIRLGCKLVVVANALAYSCSVKVLQNRPKNFFKSINLYPSHFCPNLWPNL